MAALTNGDEDGVTMAFAAARVHILLFFGPQTAYTSRFLYGLEQQAIKGDPPDDAPPGADADERVLWESWGYFRGFEFKQSRTMFVYHMRKLDSKFDPDWIIENYPQRVEEQRRLIDDRVCILTVQRLQQGTDYVEDPGDLQDNDEGVNEETAVDRENESAGENERTASSTKERLRVEGMNALKQAQESLRFKQPRGTELVGNLNVSNKSKASDKGTKDADGMKESFSSASRGNLKQSKKDVRKESLNSFFGLPGIPAKPSPVLARRQSDVSVNPIGKVERKKPSYGVPKQDVIEKSFQPEGGKNLPVSVRMAAKHQVTKRLSAEDQQYVLNRMSKVSGINPFSGKSDSMDRVHLEYRVRRFYEINRPSKLNKGIGRIVDYGMEHGMEKLNRKLRGKYGNDLETMEENLNNEELPDADSLLMKQHNSDGGDASVKEQELLISNLRAQQRNRSSFANSLREDFKPQSFGENIYSEDETPPPPPPETPLQRTPWPPRRREERDVLSPRSWSPSRSPRISRNKEQKEMKRENRSSFAQRAGSVVEKPEGKMEDSEFKVALFNFLMEHEQNRLEKCMYIMGNYRKKYGTMRLNDKLIKKYGVNLFGETLEQLQEEMLEKERRENEEDGRSMKSLNVARVTRALGKKEKIRVAEKDQEMLNLFFAKYNPKFLTPLSVERTRRWVEQNGMASLNRRLKKKYQEDLDEFIFSTEKLRHELVAFYTVVDRTKLVKLDAILTWGVLNGRDALNENLEKKYGTNLDSSTKDLKKVKAEGINF